MFLLLSTLAFATPESELRQGMWLLNGWAVGNMASSAPSAFSLDQQSASYHQMNIGWSLVNAGLASYALLDNKPVQPQKLAQIFWLNAGLDILYMTGGYILRSKGLEQQNPQWVGWGNSIMLQGGFLFVFDGVMGWRMQSLHKKQSINDSGKR